MIATKFHPEILVQMIQRYISHQMVELVYYSHERWPLPRTGSIPPGCDLRIMVLDSSFNPPTKAHLALANHPRPPTPADSDGSKRDYDAKLLLISLLNADKHFKPGDATYAQRLEMMSLLAEDVVNRNSSGEGEEPGNVAVAVIQRPTFVEKSTVLRSFLNQRLAELNTKSPKKTPHDVSLPSTNLTFMLGFDTLERVFAPRYYDSEEDMFSSLGKCLGNPPAGEGSRVVCAHRNSSQDAGTEAAQKTLALAHDFITSGQIAFIDIGKEECTYSSTAVRSIIRKAESLDEVKEWNSWQSFVTDKVAAYIIKEGLYHDPNSDMYLPNMGDEQSSSMSSLISSAAWVRQGVAARHPAKYVLDDQELERVSTLAQIELQDARLELERAHEAAKSMGLGAEEDEANDIGDDDNDENWVDENENAMDVDSSAKPEENKDDLSRYNLDDYDNDVKDTALGPFSNIKGLTFYKTNDEDPYVTLKEDDEANEREELEIHPTDNLIVVAKTEDEISQLEIYVYDESQENLYVHHDLMLPNFPLCLEWLDFPPTSPSSPATARYENPEKPGFGNYIAVGTLDPEIEIWSLDVMEAMYPASILGRVDKSKAHVPTPLGTGKKKRKKLKSIATHHVDAVLGLSWNKHHRNLLASASADRTVKLWDLTQDPMINGEGGGGGAIRSFELHKDKVQAVQWNDKEPSVLLTGSYDRTVRVFDTRSPESGVGNFLGSDVEAVKWDPWDTHGFYVSLENGLVLNFDVRKLNSNLATSSPARFTLAAHDGACSSIDVNPHIKGCIATGGTDKLVKVWNVTEEGDKRSVSLVTSRDLGVGGVFSTTFSPNDPLTLAAAGSKSKLQIWDVGANQNVRKAFGAKLREAGLREKEAKESNNGGIIGVASDDEDESDGGDDD